jgi:hypothetical protein
MTKKERLALLEQHITKREYVLTEIVYLVTYLTVALVFIPATNLLLFIGMCLFLLIGFGAVRDQFLLWLNERRCESEVSSDEDSSDPNQNSQGD